MSDRASLASGQEPRVLVVGTMAVDAKGRPSGVLVPGTSVPGVVHLGIGGVGRNIAENLAHMGVQTTLVSATGADQFGRILLEKTAESGVDVSHVVISDVHRTAAYIAVLDSSGALAHAIDDMAIMGLVTPELIEEQRSLFEEASIVVVDANLPAATLDSVFRLARECDRRVCIDPTSAILAPRVQPYLPETFLVVPNLREAEVLVGVEPGEEADVHQLASRLVNMGAEIAVVALAEKGLYYATSDESGRVPALKRDVVDLTGAGAALTAAVVFGLLHGFPISEAVRLGISAAALTIQCSETVCPDLSLDRLYDELVV
jgi:pseudouridine kinase